MKTWQCKLCSFEQEEWSIYCENCNNFFTFFNQGIHNNKKKHGLLVIIILKIA